MNEYERPDLQYWNRFKTNEIMYFRVKMSIPSTSNYQILYNSDDEVGNENFEPQTAKQRKEYQQMVAELPNENALKQWIDEEDTWTLSKKREAAYYYYCRQQRTQAKCGAKLKVKKRAGQIQIFQNQDHANHEDKALNKKVKDAINGKIAVMRPAQIRDNLLIETRTAPLMHQVQSFVKRQRNKMGHNDRMTLEELQQIVADSEEPEDEHKPYVFASRFEPQCTFVAWTTKRLLNAQRHSKIMCVDGTFKINSLRWPILRAGFKNTIFVCKKN